MPLARIVAPPNTKHLIIKFQGRVIADKYVPISPIKLIKKRAKRPTKPLAKKSRATIRLWRKRLGLTPPKPKETQPVAAPLSHSQQCELDRQRLIITYQQRREAERLRKLEEKLRRREIAVRVAKSFYDKAFKGHTDNAVVDDECSVC
jgi:hypothetical protein